MFGGGETLSPQQYSDLSVEIGKLSPLVTQLTDLDSKREEAAELTSLLTDGSAESELKDMAAEELDEVTGAMAALEENILIMAMPKVRMRD
jgi:peptide chain release factor 1